MAMTKGERKALLKMIRSQLSMQSALAKSLKDKEDSEPLREMLSDLEEAKNNISIAIDMLDKEWGDG
jgi:hypothetical protein